MIDERSPVANVATEEAAAALPIASAAAAAASMEEEARGIAEQVLAHDKCFPHPEDEASQAVAPIHFS